MLQPHAKEKTSKRSSVCAKHPRRAQTQENLRKFCKGVKVQILHRHKYSDPLLWNLRTWFSPISLRCFSSLVVNSAAQTWSLCLVANSIKEKKQQKKTKWGWNNCFRSSGTECMEACICRRLQSAALRVLKSRFTSIMDRVHSDWARV